MPIYEYRCSKCGHELEALQKISEPPLSTCPACTEEALVKRVSAAGFQLKGSGWYATDFRGSKDKPATPDAKAEGGKAEGGKAEGGKAEGGKAEGGKADTAKPDTPSEGAKSDTKSASSGGGCGTSCACH